VNDPPSLDAQWDQSAGRDCSLWLYGRDFRFLANQVLLTATLVGFHHFEAIEGASHGRCIAINAVKIAQDEGIHLGSEETRNGLFRPSDELPEGTDNLARNWDKLADGGVETQLVPGTHHSMIMKPNVSALAEKLGKYLNETEAGGAAQVVIRLMDA